MFIVKRVENSILRKKMEINESKVTEYRNEVRDALKSVGRNFSLSIAAITCVVITLIIVGVALIISYNVKDATTKLKKDLVTSI